MKYTTLIITLITCVCYMQAQVIDYEIDPSFDTGSYFQKGSVNEITQTTQENFIIGGSFSNLPNIARGTTIIDYNGELIYTESSQSFGPHHRQHYLSNYITLGPIINYSNQFNQTIYSFQFEFQKPAYSGFVSGDANDVMVYQDDLLLVAGVFFTDSLDISANSLRQLCMIDETGAPIEDFPMVKCEPFDARIYTIDTLSTGEYIIAGSFTHVNGHPTNNIAKLNADFSVDMEFGNIFGNQGSAAAIIDDNDKIWMRCSNGFLQSNPNENVHFVRLESNGLLDPTYNIATFVTYFDDNSPFETGPTALLLESDNTVILTGNFVEVNGEYHKTIVQLHDDGTIVSDAFENLGADEAIWGSWEGSLGPIASTWISEIKRLEDGKLLLGGQFSSFGGEPYSCLVRLQPNGFVGLNEIEGRGKLKLYPNPAQNMVRFEIPDKNQAVEQVEIFDLSGRLVHALSIQRMQSAIDISGLQRGVYLVKAMTESEAYSQTLVLQN